MNGRQDLRLLLLVGCVEVCLSSNQIEGFFDQQYFWEESIDVVDFLCGDIYYRKVAFEATIFVCARLGKPVV